VKKNKEPKGTHLCPWQDSIHPSVKCLAARPCALHPIVLRGATEPTLADIVKREKRFAPLPTDEDETEC